MTCKKITGYAVKISLSNVKKASSQTPFFVNKLPTKYVLSIYFSNLLRIYGVRVKGASTFAPDTHYYFFQIKNKKNRFVTQPIIVVKEK